MTVTVAVLAGQNKIQSLILCSTSIYLFYSYVRWVSRRMRGHPCFRAHGSLPCVAFG